MLKGRRIVKTMVNQTMFKSTLNWRSIIKNNTQLSFCRLMLTLMLMKVITTTIITGTTDMVSMVTTIIIITATTLLPRQIQRDLTKSHQSRR